MSPETTLALFHVFVTGWFVARGKGCSTLERMGNVWHLHYGVPMAGRDHELFVYGTPVEELIRLAHGFTRGTGHYLALAHPPGDGVGDGLLAAQYRVAAQEMLMVRPPHSITPSFLPPEMSLQRVTTVAQVERYNRLQGRTAIFPVELEEPRLRYYLVYQGVVPVARGRLVLLDQGIFCLDGIHTASTHRRRGIARGMVTQMILDAAAANHPRGVLSSSDMGYPLYQQLGYQNICPITIFEK